MDDPRRRPPPFPPLAVRERGNYISVRERPDPHGGRGTLNRPKPIEVPRLGKQVLHTRLGYEACPSSEVWSFEVPFAVQLQVNRLSEDRAANCVAVALLDAANRHVAPLVATARGFGHPVTVPAGEYRIIASLGIPEEVAVDIEVNTAPPISLAGALVGRLGGQGILLSTTRRALTGRAMTTLRGEGRLAVHGVSLQGVAAASAGGAGALQAEGLAGLSQTSLLGRGSLSEKVPARLLGRAAATLDGRALLLPVIWRDDPETFWRARRSGATLELNRAYFSSDPALQRQQLLEAGL